MIDEPQVTFPHWRSWNTRPSTSDNSLWATPKDYDLGGVYLLAHLPNTPDKNGPYTSSLHLNSDVVYIGMSTRITARLEGNRHEKVRDKYRRFCKDPECEFLYYSIYYSEDWSTLLGWTSELGRVKRAFLYFTERRLLWEYAKTFGRLPALNHL